MNTEYLKALIDHPSVFFGDYIAYSIFPVAMSYGLVWLILRPDKEQAKKISGGWHLLGVLATDFVASFFRVFAAATFAGKSAHDMNDQSGFIYTILIPAIVAAIIIPLIKVRAISKELDTFKQ